MMLARPASLALLLAIAPVPAFADSLVAVSGTAVAITGDIQFDDFLIGFDTQGVPGRDVDMCASCTYAYE